MNTEQLKTKKTIEEFMTEAGAKAVSEVAKTLIDFHSKHPVKELSDFAQQEIQRDRESKWISVKDRLPEFHQLVLIAFIGGLTDECRLKVDYCFKYHNNLVEWKYTTSAAVTHWRPLPEPPKTFTP